MTTSTRPTVSSGQPDPAARMGMEHKQGMHKALSAAQNEHVVGASPGELGRAGINGALGSSGYNVTEDGTHMHIERDGQRVGSSAKYPDNSAAGWATTMHDLGNQALSDMNQNRGMNVTGESMYRSMMGNAFNGTMDPHTRFHDEMPNLNAAPANAA